jgi:predicted nucleic acid-binding protein
MQIRQTVLELKQADDQTIASLLYIISVHVIQDACIIGTNKIPIITRQMTAFVPKWSLPVRVYSKYFIRLS